MFIVTMTIFRGDDAVTRSIRVHSTVHTLDSMPHLLVIASLVRSTCSGESIEILRHCDKIMLGTKNHNTEPLSDEKVRGLRELWNGKDDI